MGEKPLSKKCLQYLINNFRIKIIGVCTREKTTNIWWKKQVLREYCKKNNIPLIKKEKILDIENIDVLISVLYPFIIEKEILNKAKIASVNLHQAPLPHYRGCNSVSHAIINGEKKYGITFHLMSEKLDSGDIIERKMFDINEKITAYELYEKANKVCFDVFKRNIKNVISGKFKTYKQENNIKSHIYPRNSLENKEVNLLWDSKKIYNFVRGLDFPPFESAYIKTEKGKIYLSTKRRKEI